MFLVKKLQEETNCLKGQRTILILRRAEGLGKGLWGCLSPDPIGHTNISKLPETV